MKKVYGLLIIIFTIQVSLSAQPGIPYISNFLPNQISYADNIGICVDDEGIVYLANRKGVIVFDANEWQLVKVPTMPTVVAYDSIFDAVWVAGNNLIGEIVKNANGEFTFNSVLNDSIGVVFQVINWKKHIIFLTPDALVLSDYNNETKFTNISSPSKGFFLSLIPVGDKLFIDHSSRQLYELKNKRIKKYEPFELSGNIIFALPLEKNKTLLGTQNSCYLFDGKKTQPISIEDAQYLADGLINGACKIDVRSVAISTMNSGCLVIDPHTGKTLQTINFQFGLPDDEIYAIATDNNNGLWLAHYYGLSRIDLALPVKNYSRYKGLYGKPQCVFADNRLWVGTNEGLFVLNEKKQFVIEKKSLSPISEKQTRSTVVTKQEEFETNKTEKLEPESKKGFLSRLFGKKSSRKEEISANKEETTLLPTTKDYKDRVEKKPDKLQIKKTYKLQSITYEYEKIKGIDAKCKQIIKLGNELFAITNKDIYLINGIEANKIATLMAINMVYPLPEKNQLLIGTTDGIKTLEKDKNKWVLANFISETAMNVYSICSDNDILWAGSDNKVYKIQNSNIINRFHISNDQNEKILVRIKNREPVFITSSVIYVLKNNQLVKLNSDTINNYSLKSLFSTSGHTWLQQGNQWYFFDRNKDIDSMSFQFLNLFDNITNLFYLSDNFLWVTDNYENIYRVDISRIKSYKPKFNAIIKRLVGSNGQSFTLTGVTLERKNNYIKIVVSAPYYVKPNSNQYAFYVDGLMSSWSNWSAIPEFNVTLPSGKWNIQVKARNIFGQQSDIKSITVNIKKPFYNQWWFYILCFIVFIGLVYLFVKWRVRQLEHDKQILEEKVRERTRQIEEQKEEILTQRDALAMQNIVITEQKNKITLMHQELTDSIRYAHRIQVSVLPDERQLTSIFGQNYFIFYAPRDIVSGDFYWAKQIDGQKIIAAADCTGHGVPGGFLSMLGIATLNEITAKEKKLSASDILNELRNQIKNALIKEGQEIQSKDGMDIALCIIDEKFRKLHFSGANNPIYLVRDSMLTEFGGDKMPIGLYVDERTFTTIEIDLKPNDEIFLFSDGFRDQIGGPNEKRLKSSGFKKLLTEISSYPIEQQKTKLESFMNEWRNGYEQVDDMLVIGIKV